MGDDHRADDHERGEGQRQGQQEAGPALEVAVGHRQGKPHARAGDEDADHGPGTQVERLPIASPPWPSWNRRSASWTADRAVPLLPGLTGVVETKQGIRLGEADLQTGDADQHHEQALDLAEGPGEGAAERTVRPHSAPPHARTGVRETIAGAELPGAGQLRRLLRLVGLRPPHPIAPSGVAKAGVVRRRPWSCRAARPAPWGRTRAAAADRRRCGWQPCRGRRLGTRRRSGPDR
jgi:hypothetical protein